MKYETMFHFLSLGVPCNADSFGFIGPGFEMSVSKNIMDINGILYVFLIQQKKVVMLLKINHRPVLEIEK